MKAVHHLLAFALLALPLCVNAQRGPSFQLNTREFFEEVDPPVSDAIKLSREVVQNLYVGPGYVTYLEFPQSSKIQAVAVGAEKVISVKVDPKNNAVLLTPLVAVGHTNLTVVFGKTPYVWEVSIRNSGEVNYRMTYSVPATDVTARLPFGPPVTPQSVPVADIMRKIAQYGAVPVTPQDARNVFYQALGKTYTWNGNILTITDAFGFTKENLIVLRVHRRNTSQTVSYLAADQVVPFVANTQFPATVRLQSTPQLFPGQAEIIYLFLQGYNITVDNDFGISLPPDSKTVESYMKSR